MRPHERSAKKPQRSKRKQASALRRAIELDLGWLRGYPTSGGWCTLPPPGEDAAPRILTLSGSHLAGATRAAKRSYREHRDALEALTGNAEAWLRRTLALLDAVKPLSRGGRVDDGALRALLPHHRAGTARALERALAGPLAGVARTLGWIHVWEPAQLSAAMAWFEAHQPALAALKPHDPNWSHTALMCAALGLRHGARADVLLEVLTAPGAFDTPLMGVATRDVVVAKRSGHEKDWPARPKAPFGARMLALVGWIHRQPDKVARRALDLVEATLPGTSLETWRSWWSKRDALVAEAERLLRAAPQAPPPRKRIAAIVHALDQLEKKMPSHVDIDPIAQAIEELASEPALAEAVLPALRVTPRDVERHPVRLLVLCMFWYEHRHCGRDHRAITRWAHALRRYLEPQDDRRAALMPLSPYWRQSRVPSQRYHFVVERDLAERRDALPRFYEALAIALRRHGATAFARTYSDVGATSVLAHFAADGIAPERAVDMADAAIATKLFAGTRYPWRGGLRAAFALCEGDAARFGQLLRALWEHDHLMNRDDADALGIAAALKQPGVAGRIADMVLGRDVKRVVAIGGRLRLLSAIGVPAVAPRLDTRAGRAPWMRRYPAALGDALRRLSSVDPRASQTAASLLGKAFSDPEALLCERNTIASRLRDRDDPRLAQRLHNLEERLRTPPALTPRSERRHLAKLEAAIDRKIIEDWEARLDAAAAAAIAPRCFGRPELPAWLREPPASELLPDLFQLEAKARKLALRLLAVRDGPYPWDLRDHPANQRFLARVAALGIDPRPWVEGIGIVAMRRPSGSDLLLQLERDPLEVLRMGAHFGTCLSPGAFNFFSAVSNAVDINKRVLYARDEDGGVVGRCLLALSDDGRILTFHPYCHDGQAEFATMVRDFALRLAATMRTDLVSYGNVSCLVASDWYDDGSVDVAGRFALREESVLDELGQRAGQPLLDLLEQQLAPLGLNAVTWPLVVALPLPADRRELFETWLAAMSADVALDTKARAAERAWNAGSRAAVRRFLHRAVLPDLERQVAARRSVYTPLLDILTELGMPGLTLRLLRLSRQRGVRRFADEPELLRLEAAARAHEALHRRKLALGLYRVLARRSSGVVRQRTEARIAALGA